MCGIVGYRGEREAQPVILSGLKKLEYRGYDSAGVAIIGDGGLGVEKMEGKIARLEDALIESPKQGKVGIGHTRWATHGEPNDVNAHPHQGCTDKYGLVHNGIIENHRKLRKELESRDHEFSSDTDTEVLIHLVEEQEGPLEVKVRSAMDEVQGSFAIAVVSAEEPDKIVGARRGSPLVVGSTEDEEFLASDIPAILDYTREIIYLEDDQVVSLTDSGIEITDFEGNSVEASPRTIDWDPVAAQKEGYRHFMLKEINEQPQAVGDTLRGRNFANGGLRMDEGELKEEDVAGADKIFIVACGTSSYAGRVAKYVWEEYLDLPIEVEIGSEFRYRNPPLDENSLVVGVSQSGETADTLAGLEKSLESGATIASVVNVLGSTVTRRSDAVLYTHAGPEIGVASTKAFTSQLVALSLLGLEIARMKGKVTSSEAESAAEKLNRAPALLREQLENVDRIKKLAEVFYEKDDFLFLGRDVLYPVALEGALKLKEISYIHAEGYPAGELKHGPIALIDENMPVVALITRNSVYDKVYSNIEEVRARKGKIIVLTDELTEDTKGIADELIQLPRAEKVLTPLIFTVPLQLLAYHIAVLRGTDVDQPRNLAKSVTVE
ncbi:MAG: glutamine--fructose-6-phosphate transaminase (isomerizing) [Candidatus Bipolaricaulota bacterium]|nr:glutamine--fructose-6-phosphate transaminase (isomerizing) [Candidatus Bipolaricaulota bacterium]MBS3792425.1 glutamine--fructose-6-phosphate transaminase (isomerizing) [Candidatus Bipolaricaulota bacterium]